MIDLEDRSRINVLGMGVDPINLAETVAAIEAWIEADDHQYICLVPVHSVLDGFFEPAVKAALNGSGLAAPDGMPLVWISWASGHQRAGRVYGPDLVLAACQQSVLRGYRHYFYGAQPGVATELADRLRARFPGLQVAGAHGPPFRELTGEERRADLDRINRADPDILWVALGSPKQERWMAENIGQLNAHAAIGVGAAFDFLTARKPQAPRWIQRSGFEWLFRLATEPRRLWRRYIRYPLFVFLYGLQLLGLRRYPLSAKESRERP